MIVPAPIPGTWARNPFDGCDLEHTERLERVYRARHPWLWRVAALVVFLRDSPGYARARRALHRAGYDGRPGWFRGERYGAGLSALK